MRRRDAVRVEIRAAEIAAQMLYDTTHDMTIEELVGWMRCGDNRERGSYPKSHGWQAGWLAAIIWSASRTVSPNPGLPSMSTVRQAGEIVPRRQGKRVPGSRSTH